MIRDKNISNFKFKILNLKCFVLFVDRGITVWYHGVEQAFMYACVQSANSYRL